MKSLKKILICATLLLTPTLYVSASAQSNIPEEESGAAEAASEPNAIQRIVESSGGNVEIIVDDELVEKILTPPESHKRSGGTKAIRPGINKMSGYRIQVFSDGRNQHSLESRARARGSAIAAKFPRYRGQVYTFSSSPNWYTRIGNFRSASEAQEALRQLKSAFPSFADEMRVVKCQIVVVK